MPPQHQTLQARDKPEQEKGIKEYKLSNTFHSHCEEHSQEKQQDHHAYQVFAW